MATSRNLYVDQGADYSLPFTVSDATGTPLNLLGYEVVSVMKRSYESTVFHQLAVEVPYPLTGEIVLTVPAQVSLAVKAGRYVYDVIIIDENNRTTRVLEGIITINPSVTKLTELIP